MTIRCRLDTNRNQNLSREMSRAECGIGTGRHMIKKCRMKALVLIFPFLFISAYASGEFAVLQAPPAIQFKGDDKLDAKLIGDVISASMGLPVQDTAQWGGLYVLDPFKTAQAAIVVYVEGAEKLNLGQKKSYELEGSSAQESIDILTSNLEEMSRQVVDVDLSGGTEAFETYADTFANMSVLSNLKPRGSLKPALHSSDKMLLQGISLMSSLADKMSTIEKQPPLLNLRISLSSIASTHGEVSPAMSDARKYLAEAISKLEAAETPLKDKQLFVVICDKSEFLRSKRATAEKDEPKNLATFYSEDYPVIFNIILWFGVVFAFSLLAISYAIAYMDPGRDSVIYRMTSTRMKKDN